MWCSCGPIKPPSGERMSMVETEELFNIARIILRVISIAFAVYLAKLLSDTARAVEGKSMARTYRLMGLAFLLFCVLEITRFFDILPFLRWDLLQVIIELIFMFTVYCALVNLKMTMAAYEHLAKRKRKIRGME